MQVVATLFIAGCGGYDASTFLLVIIMVLTLIASMGTPAALGAGAVILFTILSGVGFAGDQALITCHTIFTEKVHPSPDAFILLQGHPTDHATNLVTLPVGWIF